MRLSPLCIVAEKGDFLCPWCFYPRLPVKEGVALLEHDGEG